MFPFSNSNNFCSNCHSVIYGRNFCRTCGHQNVITRCYNCNTVVNNDAFCRYCGYQQILQHQQTRYSCIQRQVNILPTMFSQIPFVPNIILSSPIIHIQKPHVFKRLGNSSLYIIEDAFSSETKRAFKDFYTETEIQVVIPSCTRPESEYPGITEDLLRIQESHQNRKIHVYVVFTNNRESYQTPYFVRSVLPNCELRCAFPSLINSGFIIRSSQY